MLKPLLIRTLHIFIVLIIFSFGTSANAQSTVTTDESYHGFRLHLSDMKVLKEKRDYIKIAFNATNTGRKTIDINPSHPQPFLSVEYDRSIFNLQLGGYRQNIEHALKEAPIRLKVGEMAYGYVLKFSKLLPEEVIAAQQPIVENKKEKKNVPPFPTPNIENTTADKDEVFTTKGSQELTDAAIKEKLENCPDLEFVNIKVIKQTDKWITVEYSIINKGKGPAKLTGNQSISEDNLAIRAYISGVPKLSRGAITLGGIFVEDGVKKPQETLPAGEIYTAEMRLDIRKKTRYLNHLILSLDAFQALQECDRTNNVEVLMME